MFKILKFFLKAVLFIPKLILSWIASLFKIILLLTVILATLIYCSGYSVRHFLSPSHNNQTSTHESKVDPL